MKRWMGLYGNWLNKTNYFGYGLAIGLLVGIATGLIIGNLAVNMLIFTFLGGAIGALMKKR